MIKEEKGSLLYFPGTWFYEIGNFRDVIKNTLPENFNLILFLSGKLFSESFSADSRSSERINYRNYFELAVNSAYYELMINRMKSEGTKYILAKGIFSVPISTLPNKMEELSRS
jgi:hypothetical protein